MRRFIMILAAVAMFSVAASAASVAVGQAVQTEKKVKKSKAEIKEVTFHVHLDCANCVKKVQENIAFEKGVKDLKISLADQTVMLKYDSAKTSEETLKAAIEKLGYKVSGKCGPGEGHHHHGHQHHDHHHHGHHHGDGHNHK